MSVGIEGRLAVVTGSTSGIGYAIASALAKSEARVLLNGRSEEGVSRAVERLRREVPGGSVSGVAADLSAPEGTSALIASWPNTDILVNNVGTAEPRPFVEITDAEWEFYFRLHVMSAVRLSRHYVRGMMRRRWGRVLFNASACSGFVSGEMVHFGATKAAVLGLSRGLAESLANTGVTVNAFLPGPVLTEATRDFIGGLSQSTQQPLAEVEQELFSGPLATSLLKRFISPDEVAAGVVFLASAQASAITGATLRVDGGIVRTML
jgi:NAD(P)-dependent dehydrogenase (short-subunit alcohol dehydrogenase family)